MAVTFSQMAQEAAAGVPAVTPEEIEAWREQHPDGLIIDVRDQRDIEEGGRIPGAIAISGGMLPIRADTELPAEWRDERVQDRETPIITYCELGLLSGICAETLKDVGFKNVANLNEGIDAWRNADLPVEKA